MRGRGRGRNAAVVIVLTLLVAVPMIVNTTRILHQGWLPEGDNATIAIRSYDTFTRHPSLLGMRSTIRTEVPDADVFHPGPALFWTLALPLRLFGVAGRGLVVGAAALNLACVGAIALFARRRGGLVGAAGALTVLAILVWSFGDDIPHDPWNPHIILFPMTLLAFLLWSVLDRDLIALPVAVVVASFMAQCHLSTAPIVGATAVVAGAALIWQVRADRRATGRVPSRTVRILLVSATLGAACWAPVVIQQVVGPRPNISEAVHAATSGKLKSQGYVYATKRLVEAVGWRPYLLQNTPDTNSINRNPSVLTSVTGVVVLGLVVASLVLAVRDRRRTLAALSGATVAFLVGAFVASSRIPRNYSVVVAYNHRAWWPAGALVWLTLGWAAATWVVPRLRVPPLVRRWALVAPLALIVGVGAISASSDTIRTEHGSAGFPVVRRLQGPLLRAVKGHRRYLVQLVGGANAVYGAGPGLVSALVLRGYDVRLPIYDKEWGSFRRYRKGQAVDGTILVLEGTRAGTAVPGFRLVAFYDARRYPGELDGLNSGVTVAAQRLAVYLAPKAVARVPV